MRIARQPIHSLRLSRTCLKKNRSGGYADAVGEGTKSGKGPAAVGAEQAFGHAAYGWPVADFGRGCMFGRQQRPVAMTQLAPLVVGACDIDPIAAFTLAGGDGGPPQGLGVLNSGTAVAENLGDTDLIQRDVRVAKGGVAVICVAAETVRSGFRLTDELISFTADSPLAKARRDLNGLLYADGIHDSLYRAASRALTQPATAVRALA